MGYDPNQPREPAGSPTGGQWVGMNRDVAMRSRDMLESAARQSKNPYTRAATVEVQHRGFVARVTAEVEADGKWEVVITAKNPSAGNMNLELVRIPVRDERHAKLLIKQFDKTASARDMAALMRIAADIQRELRP